MELSSLVKKKKRNIFNTSANKGFIEVRGVLILRSDYVRYI